MHRNEYQGYLIGDKDGRRIRLTLPPSCADCLHILGASNSWSLNGLSAPLEGQLYLGNFRSIPEQFSLEGSLNNLMESFLTSG